MSGKPQEDPAEGARDTIEHELERQDGKQRIEDKGSRPSSGERGSAQRTPGDKGSKQKS